MSIKVTIPLAQSANDLITGYGALPKLHIESAATQAGSYTEVGTGTVIVSGQESYEVWDATGTDATWYRSRVCNAAGNSCSDYSAAFQVGATGYASLEQFKAFVRDSADATADDSLMLLALTAAKGAVERGTARRFVLATGTPTARYFEPTVSLRLGTQRVVIPIDDTFDDAPTLSADVTGDGTYTDAVTGFQMAPLNAAALGLPYTEVVLNVGCTTLSYPVSVTADWGWSAIPDTVTYATMLQASRFLKRRDSPYGVAGSPEMGNELRLLARLDPDVALMLSEFRTGSAIASLYIA